MLCAMATKKHVVAFVMIILTREIVTYLQTATQQKWRINWCYEGVSKLGEILKVLSGQ